MFPSPEVIQNMCQQRQKSFPLKLNDLFQLWWQQQLGFNDPAQVVASCLSPIEDLEQVTQTLFEPSRWTFGVFQIRILLLHGPSVHEVPQQWPDVCPAGDRNYSTAPTAPDHPTTTTLESI